MRMNTKKKKNNKWYFVTIATDMMIYMPFILSDEQQGIAASSMNQFTAVVWYSGIVREVNTRIRTI